MIKKIKVSIDGSDEAFEAYDLNPAGWNGFACPGFTLEQAKKLKLEGVTFRFDKKKDCFHIEGEGMENEEPVKGEDNKTVDGTKHLYAIGA